MEDHIITEGGNLLDKTPCQLCRYGLGPAGNSLCAAVYDEDKGCMSLPEARTELEGDEIFCPKFEPRSPRKSDGEKIFEKMKVLHETAIAKTWSSGISRIKERVERFSGGGIKNRKRRVSDES